LSLPLDFIKLYQQELPSIWTRKISVLLWAAFSASPMESSR